MNAKQVADELENIYWIQGDGKGKPFQQYANFVRQQQAEIEKLKAEKIRAYDNGYEDGRKPNTHPAKTLTDEEILKMASDKFHYSEYRLVIQFARAILRKVQEK